MAQKSSVWGLLKSWLARLEGNSRLAWACFVAGALLTLVVENVVGGSSSSLGGVATLVAAAPFVLLTIGAWWALLERLGSLWGVVLALATVEAWHAGSLAGLKADASQSKMVVLLLVLVVVGALTWRFRRFLGGLRNLGGGYKRGVASHYNKDRSPKRGYPDAESAQKVADRQGRQTGEAFSVYHCSQCPQWHVGHAKRR